VVSKKQQDANDDAFFGSREVCEDFRKQGEYLSNRIGREMPTKKIWQPTKFSITRAANTLHLPRPKPKVVDMGIFS